MKTNRIAIEDKLKTVPELPGSYQMYDKNGTIIYVGKAKNLKKRVTSYFRGSHDYKTTKMVSLVDHFEYIITKSELEAFILENNLIKKYDPKYNILQTDDKTYPYICLTSEEHPRLIYTRSVNKRQGRYYGPFPNGKACKEVVEKLNKIYPLRKCYKIPKKECLYYHLHQCLGPCINKVCHNQYEEYIKHIDAFMSGKAKEEIKYVTSLMNEASLHQNYEKAIEYRNLLSDLKVIEEKQHMEGYLQNSDIFGYFVNDEYISIQVFHLRDGKILERNGYLFDNYGDSNETYKDFIVNFYLRDNYPIPRNIYVQEGDLEELENLIGHECIIPKKGKYKELLDLVIDNAKNKINEILMKQDLEYKRSTGAIHDLEELIGVDNLNVIEAFDNSNIMGADAVSAMVVYVEGKKAPKLYRRFKIKTVEGANDFATMSEVVTRRYSKEEANPDIIVMDGGEAQVNSAKKALADIGRDIKVLGLVKDENHKTKSIWYEGKSIPLDKNSYAYKLLYDIQEEVHRYAISYFHNLHTRNMIYSKLDQIEGIGKVKREKILEALKSENFKKELELLHLNEKQISEVLKVFRK